MNDSIVRERVFDQTAQILRVDYNVPFRKCLFGAEVPDIALPSQDGQSMIQERPAIGRVDFVSGEELEFADAEAFLKCIQEELPYRATSGFDYEVLTNDPAVRKAVDDIVLDFFGEENTWQLEDYQKKFGQGMTMGGK